MGIDIRKILQSKGLEESLVNEITETINSELPKHFVKKDQYSKKVNAIDELQNKINDLEAKSTAPNEFETKYQEAINQLEEYKNKETNSKKLAKIKEELKKANYTNDDIVNSISRTIDLSNIEVTEEGLKGFDVSAIDNTFGVFKTQVTTNTTSIANPPKTNVKDGYTREEIKKMTPEQINNLYKQDPQFTSKIKF